MAGGPAMIALFTDFGLCGPYTGQIKAVLAQHAPSIAVVDLFADLPAHPKTPAYLLAPMRRGFRREPCSCAWSIPEWAAPRGGRVEADGRISSARTTDCSNSSGGAPRRRARGDRGRPESLSASFHGRDLFAPVAATSRAARPARATDHTPLGMAHWPDDLAEIVYVDSSATRSPGSARPPCRPRRRSPPAAKCSRERAPSPTSPQGEAFWYENSNGLAEIAVNRGRADPDLGLAVGTPVSVTG